MQDCTHLSRFALVSRGFAGRYAKKYTGHCIIACVPIWLRGKDLNQRPPGYEPDELPAALPRGIQLRELIYHGSRFKSSLFSLTKKTIQHIM